MRIIYEYRYFCTECNIWKNMWTEGNAYCTENSTHNINNICITDQIRSEVEQDLDFEKRVRVVNTSKSDTKTWSFFTSAGDDINGNLGNGNSLQLALTTTSDNTIETSFREWVEFHYGDIWYQNFEIGDYADCWLSAPGTVLTGWTSGDKYNLQDLGSGNYCIIQDNINGIYTITGNPIPVEAYDPETWEYHGFWNWDGLGNDISHYTYCADGKGQFNFYPNPTDIDLGWIVKNLRPLGTGLTRLMNEDAASIYPGWKIKVKLFNHRIDRTVNEQLALSIMLKLNRKNIR